MAGIKSRHSPKKPKVPKESLWQKIKGWYAAVKRMLVPLAKEYSAAAMARTVILLEWLAEKHLEKGTRTRATAHMQRSSPAANVCVCVSRCARQVEGKRPG
jgi:hypothetical protein